MFCAHCGYQLSGEVKFCSECGAANQKSAYPENSDQQTLPSPLTHASDQSIAALLAYLRDVLHCESTLIGFESTIQQNREIMANLCIPKTLPPLPVKPDRPQEITPSKTGRLGKAGVSGALGLIVPPIGLLAGAVATYQATIGIGRDKKNARKVYDSKVQTYNQRASEYEDEMRSYQAQQNEDNLRISQESAQKQLYEDQSSELNNLISHTKETLSILYGMNVLHKKYQNLVAVASVYDYLSTGRTTSLARTGNDPGAYNIYEEDVRIGKIMNVIGMVGKQIIGTVNKMADSVRYQQQALYDAVTEGNELQRSLSTQLSSQLSGVNERQDRSNILQEEILKQEKLRTDALREHNPYGKDTLKNKSGYSIDE